MTNIIPVLSAIAIDDNMMCLRQYLSFVFA